ncbi:MAG: alkaline phosphatase D family protein, partial [Actinomycetota bacterium]|nr:alkaline phosphatase D family protein [Actinomycetota bacterium]
MSDRLVLGPVLRHVDRTSATVWVQTVRAGTVAVAPEGHDVCRARTFTVHGCHYALVEVGGLLPGAEAAYRVLVDDEVVWPEPDSPFPPSVIRTLDDRPLRMAFGSCRTSVPHDAEHHRTHGVDALRTYALALADGQGPQAGQWPHLMLLLGDQVYADVTSPAMREFIADRRSLEDGPGEELKDYTEYAHLYSLAWRDPALRWLLSCLPSLMVFDDHDVRDDWNTSARWREEMAAKDWWHGRIVAALGSYWVYQHLGNLSPQERAQDETWQELQRRQAGLGPGSVDLSEVLDSFAARVDERPETYRWSYARDLDGSRLVVV